MLNVNCNESINKPTGKEEEIVREDEGRRREGETRRERERERERERTSKKVNCKT